MGRLPPLDVFISYRREDSSAYAGRLADILLDRFGRNRVFMDIDTIEPGVDYNQAIDRAIGHCSVLIALIGPHWFDVADHRGRRLDNPHDLVRLEIEAALDRDIRVIPVLVGGADMPHADELPGKLANLATRNAVELSDRRFRSDAQFLIEAIEKVADPNPRASTQEGRQRLETRTRRTLLAITSAFVVLVIAGGGYALVRSQGLAGKLPELVSTSTSPTASPPPLHTIPPKGPLVWKAAMDGTAADVQQPRVILSGGQAGSDIKLAKGYMEFDVLSTGGQTGYDLRNKRTKSYVGEIDVTFQPGTDVNLWWTIDSDADSMGSYAVWIDSANENVTVFHQRLNSSTPDFKSNSEAMAGLQQGHVFTIAVVVSGQDIVVYLDERKVIEVHATAVIGATNGQLFINGGQPGWYRILGIRYYALPGG